MSSAARGVPNVKILQMPAEELECPPEHFDSVFCLCVFPHFDDKRKVLAIFRSVLKPSGRLALAHLEGSRIRNHLHRKVSGLVQRHLFPPSPEMELLLFEEGLGIFSFRDDDDGSLVIAGRQG